MNIIFTLVQPGNPPPPDGQPVTISVWLLVIIGALAGAFFIYKRQNKNV